MNDLANTIQDSISNGLLNIFKVQILFLILYFIYKNLLAKDFRKPKITKEVPKLNTETKKVSPNCSVKLKK